MFSKAIGRTSFILICVLLSNSCALYTFYPIYSEKDVIEDRRLLGKWRNNNPSKSIEVNSDLYITFRPAKGDSREPMSAPKYNLIRDKVLIMSVEDEHGDFSDYLCVPVKIGSFEFLDRFPLQLKEELNISKRFSDLIIKKHQPLKIDFTKNGELQIRELDDSVFSAKVEQREIFVKNLQRNLIKDSRAESSDLTLHMATTAELQSYIIKYAGDTALYYPAGTWAKH